MLYNFDQLKIKDENDGQTSQIKHENQETKTQFLEKLQDIFLRVEKNHYQNKNQRPLNRHEKQILMIRLQQETILDKLLDGDYGLESKIQSISEAELKNGNDGKLEKVEQLMEFR